MWWIILIVVILVTFRLYIKIYHSFWSIQPVQHLYDIHYRFYKPTYINKMLPEANKYVNKINIRSENFLSIKNIDLEKFTNFLKCHYLQNKYSSYTPILNHVVTPFKNCSHPSYLLTYKTSKYIFGKNQEYICDNKLLGIISARQININLSGLSGSFGSSLLPVYYVDNLCVHKDYRKKGIAQELIQTLYYDTRRANRKIMIYLFKREGDITAIVPLVKYNTIFYNIPKSIYQPIKNINIVKVNPSNIDIFYRFISENCSNYTCKIYPDLSNLLTGIKDNYFSFYMLINNKQVESVYGIKNPYTTYNNEPLLECFFSYYNNYNEANFIWGFWEAIRLANKDIVAKKFYIESLGTNNDLISILNKTGHTEIYKHITAYFLYNFIYKTVESKKINIIL